MLQCSRNSIDCDHSTVVSIDCNAGQFLYYMHAVHRTLSILTGNQPLFIGLGVAGFLLTVGIAITVIVITVIFLWKIRRRRNCKQTYSILCHPVNANADSISTSGITVNEETNEETASFDKIASDVEPLLTNSVRLSSQLSCLDKPCFEILIACS